MAKHKIDPTIKIGTIINAESMPSFQPTQTNPKALETIEAIKKQIEKNTYII